MEHIIQELDLNPDDMTREDIIRRRALQVIGAKLIRRVGDVEVVDGISEPLREEFVHFNYATKRGAARLELIERCAAGENVVVPLRQPMPDLSDLRQSLRAFSTDDAPDAAQTSAGPIAPPVSVQPAEAVQQSEAVQAVQYDTPRFPNLQPRQYHHSKIQQPGSMQQKRTGRCVPSSITTWREMARKPGPTTRPMSSEP